VSVHGQPQVHKAFEQSRDIHEQENSKVARERGGGVVVAPFHRFDAVVQSDCAPTTLGLRIDDHFACGQFFYIVAWNLNKNPNALDSGPTSKSLRNPRPVIMLCTPTLPRLPIAIRRKRELTSWSASSSESVEASTRPYILENPLITPGGTPGWASQPWHYVFKVCSFQKSGIATDLIDRMGTWPGHLEGMEGGALSE
jgi:hypothetical protein